MQTYRTADGFIVAEGATERLYAIVEDEVVTYDYAVIADGRVEGPSFGREDGAWGCEGAVEDFYFTQAGALNAVIREKLNAIARLSDEVLALTIRRTDAEEGEA